MCPGFDSNSTSNDDNSLVEVADGTTTGSSKPRQKVGSDNRAWVDAAVSVTTKTTYSAFSSFSPTGTLTTDVFTITGSASKTIKIRQVAVHGSNTGNTNALIILLKRSTASTGGTSTTLTNVAHDSASAAGTAVVKSYTANPTVLGTLVGNITGRLIFMPSISSVNAETGEVFELVSLAEPITLRGTSEIMAVNFNGVTLLSTSTLYISVTWTEE